MQNVINKNDETDVNDVVAFTIGTHDFTYKGLGQTEEKQYKAVFLSVEGTSNLKQLLSNFDIGYNDDSYFEKVKPDLLLLETGLGGRLDATNVIKTNLCAIITHIDFDHTERLGDTLEQIAFEKSGIIKKNCLTIVGENYEIFSQKSDNMNSKLIFAKETGGYEKYLNLKGLHQKDNLTLALACIKNVFPDIKSDVIVEGLKNVKHPFRFEYKANENLIIDAAHNPNGISALRKNLDYYYPDLQRRFIFGCLKNKDYESMIKILFKPDDEIYFSKFNYPNSADINDLQSVCSYNSFELDYKKFNINDKTKLTVICGSFYMLKEIIDKLGINDF